MGAAMNPPWAGLSRAVSPWGDLLGVAQACSGGHAAVPGSSTVWGGSDREVTPWESARTSRTVPPGGRVPEPAARLGAVVPVHWRLWPAVVQGLERRRPTVQWVLWAGRQQAAPRGWVFFFFFSFFFLPSHIPPALLAGARVRVRVRGPVLIFRKNILYGVFKKWAHGHTNHLPVCTFSGTWSFSADRRPQPTLRHAPDSATAPSTPACQRPMPCNTATHPHFVLLRTRPHNTHTSSCSGLAHTTPTLRRAPDSPTQHPHFAALRTRTVHSTFDLNYIYFFF